jgi:hypothetical protein
MSVECLSYTQKLEVSALYKQDFYTQEILGGLYNVSTASINKTLQEMGVTKPRFKLSPQQAEILHFVRQNKLTLNKLQVLCANQTVLNPINKEVV